MFKSYILITLRNFNKNKLFIFINVLGLGVAIACCIVAYLNLQFDQQWDTGHKNAASIYRVQFWNEFQGKRTRYGMSPIPLGNYIRANMSPLENGVVRFIPAMGQFRVGNQTYSDQVAYADSSFFDLFTFQLLSGSFANFKDPSKIFISDQLAIKYFGRLDVVGSSITQVLGDRQKPYIVGGVFKRQPMNSSFYSDAFTEWSNYWSTVTDNRTQSEDNWGQFCNLFLKINDPANVQSVTAGLKQYVAIQNLARPDLKVSEYYLENFKGMAHRNRKEPRMEGEWLRIGLPPEATIVPGVMALFLLLLACFNFTNTSIAVSSRRLKEIGMRKVMGSRRIQLILQFMGENILICLLGLLCGLVLAEFFVPVYDDLANWVELRLRYSENIGLLVFLSGVLIFTAIFAGGYPAFYITSFNSIDILRNKLKIGGTNWFTRILLGVQFAIAVLCIVFSVAFYKNARYQKNYDLGFNTDRVISAYVTNENGFNVYRDALSSDPAITSIAGSKNHIADNSFSTGHIKYNSVEISTDMLEVGDGYLDAMDMKILSGRNFVKSSATDKDRSILVTEEFVKKIGWHDNPIGKAVLWGDTTRLYVIGVVKDIYARALWRPLEPLIIRYVLPDDYRYIIVKTTPANMKSVDDFMQVKWRSIFPKYSYSGQRVDNVMTQTNNINSNVVKVFSFLGLFSTLLSLTGLYTLVSLNIIKEMKQMAIRKVLGASSFDIVRKFNLEFFIILLIASVLGGTMGYLASGKVMSAIWDHFKTLDLLPFFITVMVMVLCPLLITISKAYAATKINPATTLRNE